MDAAKRIDEVANGRIAITVPETAALLGESEDTGYRLAREGHIPTVKMGRKYFVPVEKLKQLMGVAA